MSEFATAGSQRWLQIAIDQHPAIIDSEFRKQLALLASDPIDWVSPLRTDDFKEYRDMEALR